MPGIRELFGLVAPLTGLEGILEQVAKGELSSSDAAAQIRSLASKPHIPAWFPLVFRVMGVVFVLVGVGFGCFSVAYAVGTREVQGEVTDLVGGSPVVDYEVDGKKFSVQSAVSSSPPAYSIGEKVSVLYRPNNPASAQINSFTERWLFPVAFTAAGVWGVICSYLIPRWISFFTGTASR